MSRALRPVSIDDSVIAVSFSTRISVEARRTIERVALERDMSIRQVVELAIADRWGVTADSPMPRAVGE